MNIQNNKPRFIRCIDKYSTPIDTRNYKKLKIGETYMLSYLEVHDCHTYAFLEDFYDYEAEEYLEFNSVLFEEIEND